MLSLQANANLVFGTFDVPAKISVSYYENMMPIIVPDHGPVPADRRVYIVKAVVEFCRTVSSGEFSIQGQKLATGGYILQLVSASPVIDCFGPTHTQELTYGLPLGVDGKGPFYSAEPINVDYLGAVH